MSNVFSKLNLNWDLWDKRVILILTINRQNFTHPWKPKIKPDVHILTGALKRGILSAKLPQLS